jgi:hypothetical protein
LKTFHYQHDSRFFPVDLSRKCQGIFFLKQLNLPAVHQL